MSEVVQNEVEAAEQALSNHVAQVEAGAGQESPAEEADHDEAPVEEVVEAVGLEGDEAALVDGATDDPRWLQMAIQVADGGTLDFAWNSNVIGLDPPSDKVMYEGVAGAVAGLTREVLMRVVQRVEEPEGEPQLQQQRRRVPKKFKQHCNDQEITPASQFASLHRQAVIACEKSVKLGNVQSSGDPANVKAQRMIVMAAFLEKEFTRLDHENSQLKNRVERQKNTLSVHGKTMELLQTMCSIEAESLDVSGEAPLTPGRRNSDTHPHLDGFFGDFYGAVLSGQAVLTRNIENTVKYYKRRNATNCANCRKSINMEFGRIYTCKVCLQVLYCEPRCAERHKTEHYALCVVHEGWGLGAQDAGEAVGNGKTASFPIGGVETPAQAPVLIEDDDEDHDALPSAQEGGKGAKGVKGGKGGKGTKGAKGSKGSKGGKSKKRKRNPSASQRESYHSGGSWEGGWKDTRCFNCWETGHIASDCPRNHEWY